MIWTALTGRKVQCGESQWYFPHKTPKEKGAHDAQGLLLGRVDQVVVVRNTKEIDAPMAMLEASRRKIFLSKTACRMPIFSHTNVRLHFSFTMGPQCPRVCCGISPRSRKKCKHCHQDRPSARWTSSIRVDEDPRAQSDWQFHHWQSCVPWHLSSLPRCHIGHSSLAKTISRYGWP